MVLKTWPFYTRLPRFHSHDGSQCDDVLSWNLSESSAKDSSILCWRIVRSKPRVSMDRDLEIVTRETAFLRVERRKEQRSIDRRRSSLASHSTYRKGKIKERGIFLTQHLQNVLYLCMQKEQNKLFTISHVQIIRYSISFTSQSVIVTKIPRNP